jgi:MFS family permease
MEKLSLVYPRDCLYTNLYTIMRHHEYIARHKHVIYTIGIINFLFTLHIAVPAYVDSSYLSLFSNQNTVGLIYMAAAAITVLCFFFIYRVLKRYGDYRTALVLIILDGITLAGIVWGGSFLLIAISFVLNMAVAALIGYTNDVFLETYTDVAHTGGVRGFFLTLTNGAWILSPLIAGMLIATNHSYGRVYIAALAILAPVLYLVHKNFKQFPDSSYVSPSSWQTLLELGRMPDIWKLCVVNVVLNTFYSWMVIYTPLYLASVIGFDWSSIGIILTVMLIPFVLIQLPVGRLVDENYSERELMAVGFVIMGAATIALGFVHSHSLIVWAGALFVTRIGAALAEVMIQTYFFKSVDPKDSNILASFWTTRQIPYFLAPALTGLGLFITDESGLFVILGGLCLVPLFFIASMRNLKKSDQPEEITATGKLP